MTDQQTAAWLAGTRAMQEAIAAWHAEQSRWFGTPRPNICMTAEDRAKFAWASASHAAHATHIRRMPLPAPPAQTPAEGSGDA
ncbi:conserved protein of unknown function [Rhodovastum atsumiense]|uniref:Uncharacterized protein n=1 Tax=Rhodovastum atsumiense TaxID=504468 RepID=A0A5M6J0U4_9PROT|nr:hypothetical protein [Rhodovastum atsumiense]KAA5613819.1 hypothetical protein F1189_03315 [Rhodovastum atsumiense]CAH2601920.1 conserved protein of unknown function [Rhodovastum atsumiense]